MASVYIHVPFCRSKCHYCNFVSVASQTRKEDYVEAVLREIFLRNHFFGSESVVETVYFGGGTPSLLTSGQVNQILNAVRNNFQVSEAAEITLEMNPEDADVTYLKELVKVGINRISLGIQSFVESELRYLGRNHDAASGVRATGNARHAGFENISIDLIFGLPRQFSGNPTLNIEQAIMLKPEHISAYGLTMEPDTILSRLVKKDKMLPPDEELSAQQFLIYMEQLRNAGYENYEISNYALPGFRSKHNSAYWKNVPYLGVGAGAHSYNLKERIWNTAALGEYIDGIAHANPSRDFEVLTAADRYNEYILTSIRTIEGVNVQFVKKAFGEHYFSHFLRQVKEYQQTQHFCEDDGVFILTDHGKLWADKITGHLMIDNQDEKRDT
jgi:oxygen-independent coproporphyrinogen III oxidase